MHANEKSKAIVSLFDLTGVAVKPWAEAGYHTFQFAAQHPVYLSGQGRQ